MVRIATVWCMMCGKVVSEGAGDCDGVGGGGFRGGDSGCGGQEKNQQNE